MLATRVATAAVALPLTVAGIVLLPAAAIVLIVAAIMLLGAWEWGSLLRLTTARRAGFVVVVAAMTAAFAAAGARAAGGENLIIGAACAWWLWAIYWIARFPAGGLIARRRLGAVVGAVALVAPTAAITSLRQSDDGPLLLLILFCIVWAADTGAYFAGRALGRHRLAPRVSPGKTREGALGGLGAATLIAGIGAWVLGYGPSRTLAFMVLGAWVALMSIVGDLTLSLFKRQAGLKDSGRLFPGHGGVLDRLDSLLAAAPWFVAGLHWLPAQF